MCSLPLHVTSFPQSPFPPSKAGTRALPSLLDWRMTCSMKIRESKEHWKLRRASSKWVASKSTCLFSKSESLNQSVLALPCLETSTPADWRTTQWQNTTCWQRLRDRTSPIAMLFFVKESPKAPNCLVKNPLCFPFANPLSRRFTSFHSPRSEAVHFTPASCLAEIRAVKLR